MRGLVDYVQLQPVDALVAGVGLSQLNLSRLDVCPELVQLGSILGQVKYKDVSLHPLEVGDPGGVFVPLGLDSVGEGHVFTECRGSRITHRAVFCRSVSAILGRGPLGYWYIGSVKMETTPLKR